jgi:hypothetical protein
MNIVNKIDYLVGDKKKTKTTVTEPYDELSCDFIADLSLELSKIKSVKEYPDIKTLSFWCRRQNIKSLKNKFYSTNNDYRIGVGLVFHITPSNIPTNFAYSLLFGLLSGNSNIIKIPSKKFSQIDIICDCIKKVLKKKKYLIIQNKIKIVRYSNKDQYTKKISAVCDARLIWGGNNSINNIRNFRLKERSIDIAFSDRFSFCAINGKEILKLNTYELNRLIEKFYNDTFLVDQNACSSPHLIIWLNDHLCKARDFFWKTLNHYISKKYYQPEIASIDKYSKLCEDILNLNDIKSYRSFSNSIYVITLKNLNSKTSTLRGKWGYFYEYGTDNLKDMLKFINKDCQTLSYFGLSKSKLKELIVKNNTFGVDRIVPIGQTLDMNLTWDGYDLNRILSRIVDIK